MKETFFELLQNSDKFGYRELSHASKLLEAYAKEPSYYQITTPQIGFNLNSGFVFLYDAEYETPYVYIYNGEERPRLHVACPECGNEVNLYQSSFEFESELCPECKNAINHAIEDHNLDIPLFEVKDHE